MPLSQMLAGDRFLQGWDSAKQRGMQELQQGLTLSGLIEQQRMRQMQAQEMQRKAAQAQAYQQALSKLGPNPTQEQMVGVATQFGGPGKVLDVHQKSLDRKAQFEQHMRELTFKAGQEMRAIQQRAQEGRITKAEADARAAELRRELQEAAIAGRRELLGVAAALRPAPQPRPLQLTTDAEGNQLIVNPDGTTRPLTTQDGAGVKKVTADRPMTEFQGKAALYGTRAAQSDKILKTLEERISLPGLEAGRALGRAGNYLLSSEQRRVDQAQRDFVNAVLRQESGAVISDAEFDNAKKQYFPQPGDDANTIAQKRANRKIAIEGFARMSGPKGAPDIKAVAESPLLPTAKTTSPVDALLEKYK